MGSARLTSAVVLLSICLIVQSSKPIDEVRAPPYDWSGVDQVLDDAITNGSFPGTVVIVADHTGWLYAVAKGHFTYGVPPPATPDVNPPMTMGTLFDMASCTKVSATLSAVAQFYQRGELALDTPIVDVLGPEYGVNGKADITVLNCLLHNAGYPPDPSPEYWDPVFGCPETTQPQPQLSFSCQQQIYKALLQQTLVNPIGAVYIYSDLSFITLMYVVGTLASKLGYVSQKDLIPGCYQGGPASAQCFYEAYVRLHVFQPLGMANSQFLPPAILAPICAPTENDTVYLHRVIQGQVSDGNAFALGGIAGHAGLFSTAADMHTLMHRLVFAQPNDSFLNSTTVSLFIKEYNHSQSSRALGWNTNDPTVYDQGWNNSCGDMSPTTFMHTGFTGTELCGDPVRKLITVFLTNRVYPTADNIQIRLTRQLFGKAVVAAYDKVNGKPAAAGSFESTDTRLPRDGA